MLALASALASSAGSVISAGINNAAVNKSNRDAYNYNLGLQSQQYKQNQRLAQQQNRYNQELAERQNQYNTEQNNLAYERALQQRDYENWYNSPAQQMLRYQQAGVNPNMALGNQNLSASSPTYETTPAVGYDSSGYPVSGSSGVTNGHYAPFPNVVQDFMSTFTQVLQQDSIKADIELKESQKQGQDAMNFLNSLRGDKMLSEKPYWQKNSEYDSMAKFLNTQQMEKRILEMTQKIFDINPLLIEGMRKQQRRQDQEYNFHSSYDNKVLQSLTEQIRKMNTENSYLDESLRLDNSLKRIQEYWAPFMNGATFRNLESKTDYQDMMSKFSLQYEKMIDELSSGHANNEHAKSFNKLLMYTFFKMLPSLSATIN